MTASEMLGKVMPSLLAEEQLKKLDCASALAPCVALPPTSLSAFAGMMVKEQPSEGMNKRKKKLGKVMPSLRIVGAPFAVVGWAACPANERVIPWNDEQISGYPDAASDY